MKRKSNPREGEHEVLGQLLRKIRVEAGVSQAVMAEALGQSQSWVSRHENGELRLDFVQVRHYLSVLNISLARFARDYEKALNKK